MFYPASDPVSLVQSLEHLDSDPLRWSARVSLVEGFADQTAVMNSPSRRLGTLPIIVLSATRGLTLPKDAPSDAVEELPRLMDAFREQHRLIAQLSTNGTHRMVSDTGHSIQREQPAAVVQAVSDLVMGLRSR